MSALSESWTLVGYIHGSGWVTELFTFGASCHVGSTDQKCNLTNDICCFFRVCVFRLFYYWTHGDAID